MSGHRVSRWLLGAALLAAATAGSKSASAQKEHETKAESEKHAGGVEAGGAAGTGTEAGAEAGGMRIDRPVGAAEETGEAEEGPFKVGLDMVIGFGKTAIANQNLPGTGTPPGTTPTQSIGNSQVSTESFILGGGIELGKVGLGFLLPVSWGTFNPPDANSRGTAALGNVELEGEYEYEINEQLRLIPILGVSLPTGQGQEVPDDPAKLNVDPLTHLIDQNAYDRFAVNHAAASARGFENNALYEPNRFGLNPKVVLQYHTASGLTVEPYLKLENLIDTTGNQEHGYIAEFVPGLRVAYRVASHFEPGLRVWANLPSTGSAVAVAEPEVRLPFGPVTPLVGVILPFAGPLTSPYFVGIQAAVAARF